MEKGRLRKEGESLEKKKDDEDDLLKTDNDTIIDAMGNVIKVEKKVVLTDKEKKKMIKNLQKQIKDGKKKKTLSEDEIMELEGKLFDLEHE
jgi:hypothetical protein